MAIDRTLEQRIKYLEDIEAIRKLKSLYAQYWDMGFDGVEPSGERLAALFVEDGVWDSGAYGGRYEGPEAIANLVRRVRREHQVDDSGEPHQFEGLALHLAVNPYIDIDGDTAVGVWNGLVAASFAGRGQAMWIGVQYHDEFVRTANGWKFKLIQGRTAFSTPFDGPGWVQERFPHEAPNQRWADDWQRTQGSTT